MLFPVKQLLIEKEPPLCITKEAKVRDALSLMVQNDYSQLPIVDEKGNLVGIITEQIIISMYFYTSGIVSLMDLTIDHCQIKPVTISADSDIFEALDLLRDNYAIVVIESGKPHGILTAYDTTLFFRDLSEGLILIEDIEVTLRRYIEHIFQTEHALDAALMRAFKGNKQDPTRPARSYYELSYNEHIQLIITEENWGSFVTYLGPKDLFIQLMTQVGQTRNQLAHFRGRLEPVQRNALIRARDWLAARPKFPSPEGESIQKIELQKTTLPTLIPGAGKYEPLENWLKQQKEAGENHLQVNIQDIESILQSELPVSARSHRSWWANDYSTHVQSMAWLKAGWLVDDVDLTAGEIVFRHTPAATYPLFFADLLAWLKERRPGFTQVTKASIQNWLSISAGRAGFIFGWVLPREPVLRVELYIDTGEKAENKRLFDSLFEQKSSIEEAIGGILNWDRIDKKRASRISISMLFRTSFPPAEHESAKQWGVDMMLKFIDVFVPLIKAL
jgi:CBS domain-containing protein